MNDRQVDELLSDLDRVLAVEPSPAVAALVRTRMERETATWFARDWRLAAAGISIIAIAALLMWPRPLDVRHSPATLASTPAAEAVGRSVPQNPVSTRRPIARTTSAHKMPASAVREPEVIVSSGARIALEQLKSALRDGRLNAESLAGATQPQTPEPLLVTPAVIVPFTADIVTWTDDESGGRSGGVNRN